MYIRSITLWDGLDDVEASLVPAAALVAADGKVAVVSAANAVKAVKLRKATAIAEKRFKNTWTPSLKNGLCRRMNCH